MTPEEIDEYFKNFWKNFDKILEKHNKEKTTIKKCCSTSNYYYNNSGGYNNIHIINNSSSFPDGYEYQGPAVR